MTSTIPYMSAKHTTPETQDKRRPHISTVFPLIQTLRFAFCPLDSQPNHSHTHLFGQVEQAVFEEHVFGLAPGAVYDDDVVVLCGCVLVLHQLLQVLGLGTWVQDQSPAVPAHRSQLRVPERTKDGGFKRIRIYVKL